MALVWVTNWTRSLRIQFSISINVWKLAGNPLKITFHVVIIRCTGTFWSSCIKLITSKWMVIEHCFDDTDSRKVMYVEKDLSWLLFVYHNPTWTVLWLNLTSTVRGQLLIIWSVPWHDLECQVRPKIHLDTGKKTVCSISSRVVCVILFILYRECNQSGNVPLGRIILKRIFQI
jgi:hypothetical protein